MELRNLGPSGLRVSLVGLGCNGFNDLEKSRPIFDTALELGVNFFDTADMYGGPGGQSELVLGELMVGRRDQVILATKCGFGTDGAMRRMGASRRYIMKAVEDSLKRLKTDYIDVYQIHSPDPLTPIEETLRAMEDLARQGKILYYGGSNYLGWQMMDAHWTAKTQGFAGFISGQSEYSLLSRELDAEVIPAMLKCGVGLLPYFPIASGLLTGKYTTGAPIDPNSRLAKPSGLSGKLMTEANLAKVRALEAFAEANGHTILELAMSWLACQPVISSIISGASRPEQVRSNVAAVNWKLTHEQMSEVNSICAG